MSQGGTQHHLGAGKSTSSLAEPLILQPAIVCLCRLSAKADLCTHACSTALKRVHQQIGSIRLWPQQPPPLPTREPRAALHLITALGNSLTTAKMHRFDQPHVRLAHESGAAAVRHDRVSNFTTLHPLIPARRQSRPTLFACTLS